MSNLASECEGKVEQDSCPPSISKIIKATKKDLGGFSVRRLLPFADHKMVGPWIFFDHMGPAEFEAGQGVDVRPHPHINLCTVTYLFEGQMMHRDSLGSAQVIKPGEVNLMVAGSGIVHSERSPQELRISKHKLDGLQLWLAMPEEHEETDPDFLHYGAEKFPQFDIEGAKVKLLIGKAFGHKSPVKTFADTLYAEIKIPMGETLTLPKEVIEKAIYVISGSLQVEGVSIGSEHMAIITEGEKMQLSASEDTHFVVIGGEPLGHRHIWWNFVSSDQKRIEEAKQRWLDGKFPRVPGEEEFIPLP